MDIKRKYIFQPNALQILLVLINAIPPNIKYVPIHLLIMIITLPLDVPLIEWVSIYFKQFQITILMVRQFTHSCSPVVI